MEQSNRIKKPVNQSHRQRQALKSQIMRNLKEKGFKRVKPYPDLFVNDTGTVYSLNAGKDLKATNRNAISTANGKRVSIPKLILFVFRNEPIRERSQIRYLDGNRGNLSPSNMEYFRIYENSHKNEVNAENLYNAIRCYYEVPKRYTVKDCILTHMYLTEIIQIRCFYSEYYKRLGLDIFKSYMKGITNNIKIVAKENNTNFRDVRIIVNDFFNLLISDILADMEAGNLKVKDFQPRPKTKTQILRETNEKLKEMGLKPFPLRKKSAKEILKDFRKKRNKARNEQKQ